MCSEHQRLLEAYRAAMGEHTKAVAELARARAKGFSSASYVRRCEDARRASGQARTVLDRHVAAHACAERAATGKATAT